MLRASVITSKPALMIAQNPANRIHAKAGCSDLSTNGDTPTVPGRTASLRLSRTGHQAEL